MIKFEQVYKKYGEKTIINNANFMIEPKGCTAILGESGAGKTTIIRMINGLETITSGKIIIDGEVLDKKNILNIRFKVGFVFQNFNLFPHLTALENICFAPLKVLQWDKKIVLEKANNLLEQFNLTGISNQYCGQISGGQKQRIAIIRALMMNPKVILLDEPTSALDPNMVNEVGEVIEMLKSMETTIIMVTHNAKFVRQHCTNVLFCDKGNVEQFEMNKFFNSTHKNIADYLQYE
jgi:ABC-type polar amino acid transport system ATPase subunit